MDLSFLSAIGANVAARTLPLSESDADGSLHKL